MAGHGDEIAEAAHRTALECFDEAKGQVGLDQYEVRRWGG